MLRKNYNLEIHSVVANAHKANNMSKLDDKQTSRRLKPENSQDANPGLPIARTYLVGPKADT